MRLHARHGWGYDASFWAPLAAVLGPLAADDRGYYGEPRPDPAQPDEPHVLIGHSFGAMRMLAEAGPGCRGLVAINGFDRFVAGDDVPGVAPRVLERMARRCATDSAGTVVDFRVRCGDAAPLPGPPTDRLAKDLAQLGKDRISEWPHLPLLRLDGMADPLLLVAHRAACFGGAPARDLAGGGHLLPLTHPGWCAAVVAEFVAQLP